MLSDSTMLEDLSGLYDEENHPESESINFAQDTSLPQDLHSHLSTRKQQRQRVIATTEKVSLFFVSWSLNATGFFIARWLLITGGGLHFWLAVSLCFSISSISSLVGLSGFRVNYQEGLEIQDMQKVFRTLGGFIVSGGVTFLAVKEHKYFTELTYETAAQLSSDIRTIEGQNPELSPWLSIGIASIILISSLGIIFGFRR